MDASTFWIRFVLAVLATWRITHLLASEDGPRGVIARWRARLGRSFVGGLMDCFGCLSLWVAIPFAFYVADEPMRWALCWLALSGAAFLLERASPEPLVIHRVSEDIKEETKDGMLRSDPVEPRRFPDDADPSLRR